MNFLGNVDRRILYIIMAIVVVFALIKPLGLPIKVNKEAQMVYDAVAAVGNSKPVVISAGYDVSSAPELQPCTIAAMRQVFDMGGKVIGVSMWAQGGNLLNTAWQIIQKDYPNLQYGVDFVNLGYKPGGQVFAEKMSVNISDACAGTDSLGQAISSYPLMQGITSTQDCSLWIELASGNPGIEEVIKTVGAKGTPVTGGVTAVSAANQLPLVASGQLKGLLMGMRGAAEYEKLVNKPGSATSGMDAQSLAHVLVVLFILIGNIGYLVSKPSSGKQR